MGEWSKNKSGLKTTRLNLPDLGMSGVTFQTFPDLQENPENVEVLLPPPSPSPSTAGPSDPPGAASEARDSSDGDDGSLFPPCLLELFRSHMSTRCAPPPRLPHESSLVALTWTFSPGAAPDLSGRTTNLPPRWINLTRAAFVSIFILHAQRCLSHTLTHTAILITTGAQAPRGGARQMSDYFQREGTRTSFCELEGRKDL